MKVQALLVTNLNEIDKCEDMNIEWTPEYKSFPFLLDLSDVKMAFIDKEGDINVYLGGFSDEYQVKLEYKKELWEQLSERFA